MCATVADCDYYCMNLCGHLYQSRLYNFYYFCANSSAASTSRSAPRTTMTLSPARRTIVMRPPSRQLACATSLDCVEVLKSVPLRRQSALYASKNSTASEGLSQTVFQT